MVMVFNATFENILIISWQSALLVEEAGDWIFINNTDINKTPLIHFLSK
jgi:hypothetical protein